MAIRITPVVGNKNPIIIWAKSRPCVAIPVYAVSLLKTLLLSIKNEIIKAPVCIRIPPIFAPVPCHMSDARIACPAAIN